MIHERTGLERFLALMGLSGAVSVAWLLVPFAIGLALLAFEDSAFMSNGWESTVYEILFTGAWVLGLLGALVLPAFTCVAGVRLKAPGVLIPIAIVLTFLAYGALSFLAILGLAEFYFPDMGAGFD